MNAQELIHLTEALKSTTWTADHNPLLDLPDEQLASRLGAMPPAGEGSLAEREVAAARGVQEFQAIRLAAVVPGTAAAAAPKVPVVVDWRSYNGQNYITGVKDQGSCGSCVAFGTAAAIDGAMRVIDAAPIGTLKGVELHDVSEAQLFYCSKAGSDQHNCQTGWWPSSALAYAHGTGLAPETCFPYTPGNQNCGSCSNWQAELTKVGNTVTLNNIATMQNWIATRGPMVTCFTVYQDFYAYRSGVYRHVSGNPVGGHCVCVIGYSQTLGAWLCKNSWGPTWGLGGYFWIAFGQCGIDAQMWGIDTFSQIYKTPFRPFPIPVPPVPRPLPHEGGSAV